MRILLLGEYSNVHNTLALGLRELGHEVTVASDGDHWKGYPRDVDLSRKSLGKFDTLRYLWKVNCAFRKFHNYDVVQIINPVFLDLRAERQWHYYELLRNNNGAVFMGAYGMDYYFVKACLDCKTFRYSDFNIGKSIRENADNAIWIRDWLKGEKGRLNIKVAKDCNGIVAGLYEYYASYEPHFKDKVKFIPFPIQLSSTVGYSQRGLNDKVKFFIGIQKGRSAYKGTDIMLHALERVVSDYSDLCELIKVESVPFAEYRQLMMGSDVILDQLYSYTPAMNALEAMAQGLVVVGGGEPENYAILGEKELFPIINVLPEEKQVYNALRDIVLHKEKLPKLSSDSRLYIQRHHDHVKVAQEYLDFWKSRM